MIIQRALPNHALGTTPALTRLEVWGGPPIRHAILSQIPIRLPHPKDPPSPFLPVNYIWLCPRQLTRRLLPSSPSHNPIQNT